MTTDPTTEVPAAPTDADRELARLLVAKYVAVRNADWIRDEMPVVIAAELAPERAAAAKVKAELAEAKAKSPQLDRLQTKYDLAKELILEAIKVAIEVPLTCHACGAELEIVDQPPNAGEDTAKRREIIPCKCVTSKLADAEARSDRYGDDARELRRKLSAANATVGEYDEFLGDGGESC